MLFEQAQDAPLAITAKKLQPIGDFSERKKRVFGVMDHHHAGSTSVS
jgi:hypothetical protein